MSDREIHPKGPDGNPEREVVWLDDTDSGRAPVQGQHQVLSIGNVAKMFGVPQWMLRYYEWRGLIKRRLRLGNVRTYGWADCERLSFIIKCRKAGLPLRAIAAVIEATDDDAPASMTTSGQQQCLAEVERLEQRRKVIDEALAELNHVYALLTSKSAGPDASRRD